MNAADAVAALPAEDRQWRRGVRLLGLASAAAAVVASVSDLRGIPVAVLFTALALWLVELIATPQSPRIEAGLLVLIGCAGALLNAIAASSAGFLFAYFAAAAIGLRLAARHAAVAVALVVTAMATAILLRGGDHTGTSLTTDILGVAFAGTVTAATRSARYAQSRTAQLLRELENTRAAQAEVAALAERARLAREIHDILAHSLSGQVMSLEAASMIAEPSDITCPDSEWARMSLEAASMIAERTGADDRVTAEIKRAHHLAKGGLVETRQAIQALRGETLPSPELLPRLVEDNARSHGIHTTLEVHGTPHELASDAGLTLYRATQEALTNTAKHAGPGASATVVLAWEERHVRLVVSDERRDAFPPALPSSGYGLTGLRERAELAGGTLETGPTDRGFELCLVLPYAGRSSS